MPYDRYEGSTNVSGRRSVKTIEKFKYKSRFRVLATRGVIALLVLTLGSLAVPAVRAAAADALDRLKPTLMGATTAPSSTPLATTSLATPTEDATTPAGDGTAQAMAFLEDFNVAMHAPELVPSDMSSWVTTPLTWYGTEEADPQEVYDDFQLPPGARNVYCSPDLVSFSEGVRSDLLVVKVDFFRPDMAGFTTVTYVLQHAAEGEPYRIASVTEVVTEGAFAGCS